MNPVIVDQVQNIRRAAAARAGLAILAAGILGLAAAGPAGAASTGDVPSMVVHYDPHSLDSDRGARSLYRRIALAAAQVCPNDGGNPYWISDSVRQCREQSIARAVQAVNNPHLAAVYSSTVKKG